MSKKWPEPEIEIDDDMITLAWMTEKGMLSLNFPAEKAILCCTVSAGSEKPGATTITLVGNENSVVEINEYMDQAAEVLL